MHEREFDRDLPGKDTLLSNSQIALDLIEG